MRKEKMKTYTIHILKVIACMAVLGVSGNAYADKETKKQANPLGGGWSAEVKKADPNAKDKEQQDPPSFTLDKDSEAFVQSISDYFNNVPNMQGEFRQTSPDNKVATGRFYLKRPGKMRFDYSPPSALRIVADGKWLSIEDHDLRTADQYPLDDTPFKLLMKEKVDLLKDAKIIDVTRGESVAIITVADKEEEDSGQLKLFFSLPNLQLMQWVITDPEGKDTRIELSEHVFDKQHKDEFFQVAQFAIEAED